MNVLARLGFRRHRDLVLTTTLQPCLQCAGAAMEVDQALAALWPRLQPLLWLGH